MWFVFSTCARELLQVEVFFVGGVVGADDAEAAAVAPCVWLNLLRDRCQRLRPGDLFQLAVHPHQRRLQPLGMIVEIEGVAALDAQEFAVDAASGRDCCRG